MIHCFDNSTQNMCTTGYGNLNNSDCSICPNIPYSNVPSSVPISYPSNYNKTAIEMAVTISVILLLFSVIFFTCKFLKRKSIISRNRESNNSTHLEPHEEISDEYFIESIRRINISGSEYKGTKLHQSDESERNTKDKYGEESSKIKSSASNFPKGRTQNQKENICDVCLDKLKQTMFEKCKHVTCCIDCLEMIMNYSKRCPVCRKRLEGFQKVYLS